MTHDGFRGPRCLLKLKNQNQGPVSKKNLSWWSTQFLFIDKIAHLFWSIDFSIYNFYLMILRIFPFSYWFFEHGKDSATPWPTECANTRGKEWTRQGRPEANNRIVWSTDRRQQENQRNLWKIFEWILTWKFDFFKMKDTPKWCKNTNTKIEFRWNNPKNYEKFDQKSN